jgi:hypothetical protein
MRWRPDIERTALPTPPRSNARRLSRCVKIPRLMALQTICFARTRESPFIVESISRKPYDQRQFSDGAANTVHFDWSIALRRIDPRNVILADQKKCLPVMAPIWARSRVLGLRGSGTRSAVGKNVSLGLLEDDLSFVFTADLVVLPIVAFQLRRPRPRLTGPTMLRILGCAS